MCDLIGRMVMGYNGMNSLVVKNTRTDLKVLRIERERLQMKDITEMIVYMDSFLRYDN